ncbi:MAG: helix-turn-helix domain-containing protein [Lachnospiraceae bacterium]|nr:helix-turn-helix domain-containing protein [Candidatus Colinaster scatohippi]
MISNQVLQTTLEGLKNIARIDVCVVDVDGKVIASTDVEMDNYAKQALEFSNSPADSQELSGCQFFKIFDDGQLEYILVVAGQGEDLYTLGKMAAFQIHGLLIAYKERFDKDNFIKNLLLDNLLLVDIFSRAKKLHIQPEVRRVAMIIEGATDKDNNVLEIMRTNFGSNNKDFITAVDESNVIVVKELTDNETEEDVQKYCAGYMESLENENVTGARIAFGTIVKELKEVSRSYKEAKMALDVGKIFFDNRTVIAYSELGIGRLIYQLPIPLCKLFIKEIFAEKGPDDFDEETIVTINKFFENSLNVSETSRQLYIHRNTLVYRLDKLQKTTGLDLRVFEDAITFKIALMVVKYMNYMENLNY